MKVTHDAQFSKQGVWYPITRLGRLLVVYHRREYGRDIVSFALRQCAVNLKRRNRK